MDNVDISGQTFGIQVLATIICTIIVSIIIWRLGYKHNKNSNPLGCLFGMVMLGAFFFPIIKGCSEKNTVKILMVEGNGLHHTVIVKDVFHPKNGNDIYAHDQEANGKTILYNNSEYDMILYSVSYYSHPQQERENDYYSFGKIVKSGEYILIHEFDKPDYWFESAPYSVTIRSRHGSSSGTLKNIIDFVHSLENQGFIVEQGGVIRYKKR